MSSIPRPDFRPRAIERRSLVRRLRTWLCARIDAFLVLSSPHLRRDIGLDPEDDCLAEPLHAS